jgi:hypothetical protein
MGKIIKKEEQRITMDDGREIVRRVTTVLCPNGKFRYPVDYYDATEGLVEISQREREHFSVPGYKCLI